jgi:pimeloyl-ACP methyl ester carboxylesterase
MFRELSNIGSLSTFELQHVTQPRVKGILMNMTDHPNRSHFMTGATALAAAIALPRQARADTAPINILLVHGAWSDGSAWSRVIPVLQAAGHNVVAIQNEMLSLRADSDNTRAAIDAMPGKTLLVGHSYGGAVITAAGYDAKNVVGLVYIAAFAPAEGETLGDINGKFAPPAGGQYIAPDTRGMLFINRAYMPSCFAGDLPPTEGNVLAAVQRPVSGAIFAEKMGPPAWTQHRSWYQVSENDQMIAPDAERFMASRAGATTMSIASSHASLISHPSQIAQLILRACK